MEPEGSLMCSQEPSHWSLLTAANVKPLIFSVSDFALSYAANMFILMILYGLC
jgi:hypothetical protein